MTTIAGRPDIKQPRGAAVTTADIDAVEAIVADQLADIVIAERRRQQRIQVCEAELAAADEMIADLRSRLPRQGYYEQQVTREEMANINEFAGQYRHELAQLRGFKVVS